MADVKFSELTALTTTAAADILAVVDTSASTSKKLSIDNLFGAVPVNVAVTDGTDSSSASTGSIQTAGGVGVEKALTVGTTSTLTGLVSIGAGLVPDASDGAYLGTSSLEFSDLFLADEAVISLGDGGADVTLTHVADTGVQVNDTNKFMFYDTALSIGASADGALDLVSDGSINATVGAAGMVIKGTTPKITLGDAGAEDTFLVFDGNAQDYRIGLDDGTDILEMGVGAVHGTTTSLKLEADLNVDIAGHNGTVGLKLGGTVVTSTAAELNIMDGGTAAISTTLADTDRIVVNDAGTMKQVALSDLETFMESALDTTANITSVGTLTGLTTGTILPSSAAAIDLGSASAEWNDAFFSTGSVINFGDGQEVTLTAATTGLTINAAKKLFFIDTGLFLNSSTDGQLDVTADTELGITAPIVDIDASTEVNISNDLKLSSDSAVLGFGGDNDATLTHTDDVGLTLNSTNKLMFNDATQFVQGSSGTVLSLGATDEIDLTATAIDINGTVDISGLAVLSANTTIGAGAAGVDYTLTFNGADNDGVITWSEDEDYFTIGDDILMSSTEKIQFQDTGTHIYSSGDGVLDVVSDTTLDFDSPTVTLTAAGADQVIKHATDAFDLAFQQSDGDEVARIHDGGTAATIETTDLDLTVGAAAKGGFGFKKPVYNVTAGVDDNDCDLSMLHSGSIIMVTGSGADMDIRLPAIAAGDEGFHITFVITTVFSSSKNLEIMANGIGTDTNDNIYLYGLAASVSGSDVAGGGVVRTQDNAVAGTKLEFTCLKGGAAEQWICEYIVPSGTAPTVEAAVA